MSALLRRDSWVFFTVIALAGASARAAEARSTEIVTAKGQASVLVLLSEESSERADLEAAGERLRELSAGVVLVKSASRTLPQTLAEARSAVQRSGAVAALWVDDWRGERTLFVHVASSGRTLARRLPRGSNPVAEREELASVARGTVSALLEGLAPSMDEVLDAEAAKEAEKSERAEAASAAEPRSERPAPEPAAAQPSPAPRDREPSRDDAARSGRVAANDGVSASARAGYFGASPLVDSGTAIQSGASLGLRVWFPYELYADASYAVVPADSVTIGGTRASIARHPVTLAAGKAFALDALPSFWFSAELTAGLDRVTRETLAAGGDTASTPSAARWVLSGGARAGAAYAVAPRVSLYALFGAELVASQFRYVSESETAVDERRVTALLTKLDVGGLFDLSDTTRFAD